MYYALQHHQHHRPSKQLITTTAFFICCFRSNYKTQGLDREETEKKLSHTNLVNDDLLSMSGSERKILEKDV